VGSIIDNVKTALKDLPGIALCNRIRMINASPALSNPLVSPDAACGMPYVDVIPEHGTSVNDNTS
jgi:hypothetical protein